MRYTNPFADEIVKQLKSLGTEELFLLPLYPHYSTTTVKSSLEEFDKYKNVFKIKKIKRFYTNEFYTNALVKKIKEALNNEDASSFNLVFSAHSLPQSIIDAGDSYQSEVLEHSKIIENELKKVGLEFKSYSNAYQSKIGT